jgi:hypothetical protein
LRVLFRANGTVATLAGSTQGFLDGPAPGTQSKMYSAVAPAVNPVDGAVVFCDSAVMRVRAYVVNASGGFLTTIAGDGTVTWSGSSNPLATGLRNPLAVAVSASGDIYVSFTGAIARLSSGVLSVVAGSAPNVVNFAVAGDGGPATAAVITPQLVCLALGMDGTVYSAGNSEHAIRAVLPNGTIVRVAGNGTSGGVDPVAPAMRARMPYPYTMAMDATNQRLYFALSQNNRIAYLGRYPMPVLTSTSVGSASSSPSGTGSASGSPSGSGSASATASGTGSASATPAGSAAPRPAVVITPPSSDVTGAGSVPYGATRRAVVAQSTQYGGEVYAWTPSSVTVKMADLMADVNPGAGSSSPAYLTAVSLGAFGLAAASPQLPLVVYAAQASPSAPRLLYAVEGDLYTSCALQLSEPVTDPATIIQIAGGVAFVGRNGTSGDYRAWIIPAAQFAAPSVCGRTLAVAPATVNVTSPATPLLAASQLAACGGVAVVMASLSDASPPSLYSYGAAPAAPTRLSALAGAPAPTASAPPAPPPMCIDGGNRLTYVTANGSVAVVSRTAGAVPAVAGGVSFTSIGDFVAFNPGFCLLATLTSTGQRVVLCTRGGFTSLAVEPLSGVTLQANLTRATATPDGRGLRMQCTLPGKATPTTCDYSVPARTWRAATMTWP